MSSSNTLSSEKSNLQIPSHECNKPDGMAFSPQNDKPHTTTKAELNVASDMERNQQWATGFKLFNIISALGLVCLLMLLDTSIISTVSFKNALIWNVLTNTLQLVCPSHYERI